METSFPKDFFEFLKLLNAHHVEYLLIGGYAVGFHGYPRATGDMDIWIANNRATARKMVQVFADFGLTAGLSEEIFMRERGILRLGVPPNRLEVTTHIDGVEFASSYPRRDTLEVDGEPISLINLADLRLNKQASGRHKDLADLENLPGA